MARTAQTARKAAGGRAPRTGTHAVYRAPPPNPSSNKPKTVNLIDLDHTLDPTCMKIKELKEKIQREMVDAAKESGIREQDIPGCDEYFKELALQPMTAHYLYYSQIPKVMRRIRDMEESKIPLESTYKFKERARRFIESWKQINGVQTVA